MRIINKENLFCVLVLLGKIKIYTALIHNIEFDVCNKLSLMKNTIPVCETNNNDVFSFAPSH